MKNSSAVDHSTMKLGKLKVKKDKRTLLLPKYFLATLPPAPAQILPPSLVTWFMLLNDKLGDCTIAAALHFIMVWTKACGKIFKPTDAQALAAYEAAAGYNPKDPSTDQGAVELDILNYWRQYGFAGHKIFAYGSSGVKNIDHVKTAIFLFGGVYIGVELPEIAQTQEVWGEGGTGSKSKGSWGGHAIICVGYDQKYIHFVSWGKLMKMTYPFWNKYVSESYGVLSPDFLTNGKAPNGFDLAALQADIKAL